MPETVAALAEAAGGEAAATTIGSEVATTAAVSAGTAAASGELIPLTAMDVGSFGGVANVTAGEAASGAGAAAGGGTLEKLGSTLTNAAGSALISSILSPKSKSTAPTAATLPPVVGMPDPLAQQQAKRQALIEQMARRGRASTIMTQPSDGKLGG